MNHKTIVKIVSVLTAVCLLAFCLVACGEKAVTVKVSDMGETTEVETETGKTVSEVLDQAQITIGEKDEIDPAADEKIAEDTSDITIKRYAKVTVVFGKEQKEVELVGGTVEQAVKESGFTVDKNTAPDKSNDEYLTDGMVITLKKTVKVKIKVDGETKEVSTSAATVEDLLKEQDITLGDDDKMNKKPDAEVTDGMKIVIKRVTYKNVKETEEIDYETETQYSDSLESGTSEVVQNGVKGEKEVTYKVKYVDGKEDSRKKVSEKTTKEPVNEIISYGTADSSADDAGSNDSGDSGSSAVHSRRCHHG